MITFPHSVVYGIQSPIQEFLQSPYRIRCHKEILEAVLHADVGLPVDVTRLAEASELAKDTRILADSSFESQFAVDCAGIDVPVDEHVGSEPFAQLLL